MANNLKLVLIIASALLIVPEMYGQELGSRTRLGTRDKLGRNTLGLTTGGVPPMRGVGKQVTPENIDKALGGGEFGTSKGMKVKTVPATPIKNPTFAPMQPAAQTQKTRLDPAKRQAVKIANDEAQPDPRDIASQSSFEQFGVAGTHYETLGVAQNVTPQELLSAYEKLQAHMQDQIKRAEAQKQNNTVNKLKTAVRQQKIAYDVLRYPVKRTAYDRTLGN